MRKLRKEVEVIKIENITALYERMNNDRNGNPKYQVTVIEPDNTVTVFNCISYNIKERIKVFIESEVLDGGFK